MPTLVRPIGGVFSILSGTGATIGANTGEFYSDVVANFTIKYEVGIGNPSCYVDWNFPLGTTTPPIVTPTVAVNKSIINLDSIVTFTSSPACDGTSTLVWSFTNSTNQVIQYSPTATGVYYASCKKTNATFSNNVTVKVLPNCTNGLVLAPTVDNLTSNINPLRFNSSNTINATNTIVPSNDINTMLPIRLF